MADADVNQKLTTSSVPIKSMLKRGEIRILVVEDDKFLRQILVTKIKKEGYSVIEAVTGEEGVAKVVEEKPHIVMLDLVLPGIGGFDVLAKIKGDRSTSDIPVIILSNLGSREDIDRAMSLGAREFMVKAHHSPQEIIEHIQKALEESYLTR